ncbi:uncharacterized protein [Procambarus clarkii]|uniref:uncharacterized protein isoform X1 n=2 Tax=Procambarus clarkii TaxID=6728 RepID=UPI0037434D44
MARVVLLVVCTLLTLDLTVASYSNNYVNLIIRPAGHSRSFKWLGRGDIDNMPLHVPRPLYIPRWLPKSKPEYLAKWVPTMPFPHAHQPHAHQPHAHQPYTPKYYAPKPYAPKSYASKPYAYQPATKLSEFGGPKINSVVQRPNSPSYGMVPPSVISAAFPIASSHSTGYAPPHPGDIVSGTPLGNTFPATVGASLTVGEPSPREYNPPRQYLVVPETGIRSQASGARAVPSFEDLIHGAATVHFSEFSAPQPNSVITLENPSDSVKTVADYGGNSALTGGTLSVADYGGNSALTGGTLSVAEPPSPTITTILYGDWEKGVATDAQLNTSVGEDTALVSNKEPSINTLDANFPPPTTTQILDGNKYLETWQESPGSPRASATVVSLPLEYLQRDVFARENDVVFVDVSQSLNFEPNPGPDQDTELSVYLQVNQDFRPSQLFDSEGFRPNPKFNSSAISQPTLEVVSYKNSQTNPESVFGERADYSLEYDENSKFTSELDSDDSFQLSEKTGKDNQYTNSFKTNPKFLSNEGEIPVNSTAVATSRVDMTKSGLLAPPVLPPVAEGRSFSHHSILPLTGFIPQPVSVPLAPSALTLNRPGRTSEGRQARGFTAGRPFSHLIPEASRLLPLGARVQFRPSRRHYPRPVFLG